MIDEDIPCEEILSQINAAKSALNGCGKVVLKATLNTASGTASNMVTQIRPLKALQRQWSALPTCNDISAQRLKIQRNLTSYTNIQSQSIQGWLFCVQKRALLFGSFYNCFLTTYTPIGIMQIC